MTYSNMANTQLDGRRMSAGHVQGRINSMANPGSTDIFLSIPTLSTATTTTSTVTTTMSSRVSDNSTVQRSSQANNELLQQSTPAGGAFQNRNQYFAPPGDRRSEEINLPPEMQRTFNRLDQATETVRRMSTEQRTINQENSLAITRLSQILEDVVHSQRDLMNRIGSRDNSVWSNSPVDFNITDCQLRGTTLAPPGQGLAGGDGTAHPSGPRNQPENNRDRTEAEQNIPLSERINFLNHRLNQLHLSQNQQQTGARGDSSFHNRDSFGRRSGHDSQGQYTGPGMALPPFQSPYQNLNRGTRYFMHERRRKDILSSLKLGNLIFPQDRMSVEEFLHAVESRAHREGWTEDEVLGSMGPVYSYEDLLNALHEASRCIEEAGQSCQTQETVKPQEKTKVGVIGPTVEKGSCQEEELELSGYRTPTTSYDNKYGVQVRTNQNHYRQPHRFQTPRIPRPCYNCGVPGHSFVGCENPRQDVCNNCLKIGHTRQNCPLLTIDNRRKSSLDSVNSSEQCNDPRTENERKTHLHLSLVPRRFSSFKEQQWGLAHQHHLRHSLWTQLTSINASLWPEDQPAIIKQGSRLFDDPSCTIINTDSKTYTNCTLFSLAGNQESNEPVILMENELDLGFEVENDKTHLWSQNTGPGGWSANQEAPNNTLETHPIVLGMDFALQFEVIIDGKNKTWHFNGSRELHPFESVYFEERHPDSGVTTTEQDQDSQEYFRRESKKVQGLVNPGTHEYYWR
ncbi:hypothetical protein KQX54_010867 [Cotesia glomerata]|uniref:CCHC-type domain-containing protein n=1 Tax=Cotesia glomerata TaxID=32391 RepID=A0AAV7I2D2_COTGL|nr:hypothetical protein KQX54_010867 [Cotesia glomerata]